MSRGNHPRGFLEGLGDLAAVADLRVISEVAAIVRPNQRSAGLQRRNRAHHCLERVVIDRDRLSGVPGLLQRIGNDEGDSIATWRTTSRASSG